MKQSEEELYARHREMKEALEKQRLELEDKKRRLESGRPLTPEKNVRILSVSAVRLSLLGSMLTLSLLSCPTTRPRRRASSGPNSPHATYCSLWGFYGSEFSMSSSLQPIYPDRSNPALNAHQLFNSVLPYKTLSHSSARARHCFFCYRSSLISLNPYLHLLTPRSFYIFMFFLMLTSFAWVPGSNVFLHSYTYYPTIY